jgi:hypothetical protein
VKRQELSARAHAVLAAVVVLDGSSSWEEIRLKASVTDAQLVGTLFHLEKLGLVAIGEGRRVVRPCSWGVRYCGGRKKAQAFVDALTHAG